MLFHLEWIQRLPCASLCTLTDFLLWPSLPIAIGTIPPIQRWPYSMFINSHTHSHFLSTHFISGSCKTLRNGIWIKIVRSQGAVNKTRVQTNNHCNVLSIIIRLGQRFDWGWRGQRILPWGAFIACFTIIDFVFDSVSFQVDYEELFCPS